MAAIVEARAYQIQDLIDRDIITTDSIAADIISALREGKSYKCPQCSTSGIVVIETVDSECPTCLGDGYTVTAKKIDLDNSLIYYIDIV